MARARYTFFSSDQRGPYFLTATTVNWLELLKIPEIASITLGSLQFLLANQRIELYAYVIMPNHIHLIAAANDISKQIANFKSYTARCSIDYLQSHSDPAYLQQLAACKLKHKHDRLYQFWQEGTHPQLITTESMLRQKIDYIHQNPVRKGYVEIPEAWEWSSAREYLGFEGVQALQISPF